MNQEKIGKFIAKKRKQNNLTQQEFAEKLGVTDKTVSRWENGHYLPDISLFNEICIILDIEITELLKGEQISKDINKEEVDKTIMEIVDISSNKIKKNKKKIIIICSIILIFIAYIFTFILVHDNKKNNDRPSAGDTVPYVSQMSIKEKR